MGDIDEEGPRPSRGEAARPPSPAGSAPHRAAHDPVAEPDAPSEADALSEAGSPSEPIVSSEPDALSEAELAMLWRLAEAGRLPPVALGGRDARGGWPRLAAAGGRRPRAPALVGGLLVWALAVHGALDLIIS